MDEYKVENWKDYWDIFDILIELLNSNNQTEIVSDFKDAQKYVNGLTDGWYELWLHLKDRSQYTEKS